MEVLIYIFFLDRAVRVVEQAPSLSLSPCVCVFVCGVMCVGVGGLDGFEMKPGTHEMSLRLC